MGAAFIKWLVGLLIEKGLAAIGSLIAAGRRDRANVEKGAAQAKAEGLQQEADALKKTQAAINAAGTDPMKDSDYRD